jgi:hypothetical protein
MTYLGGCGCGSSYAAIFAGAHAEMKAKVMSQALGDAGLLDENLAAGFKQIEEMAHGMTNAGVEAVKHDLLGTLFDAVG